MTYRIGVRVTLYSRADTCDFATRDRVDTVRAVSRRHAVRKALSNALRDYAGDIEDCERNGGQAEVEVSIIGEVAA